VVGVVVPPEKEYICVAELKATTNASLPVVPVKGTDMERS
jgi:hypothetical protein